MKVIFEVKNEELVNQLKQIKDEIEKLFRVIGYAEQINADAPVVLLNDYYAKLLMKAEQIIKHLFLDPEVLMTLKTEE